MSDKFKIGDVVRLNSGGLPMTAIAIMQDHMVRCHWFFNGKLEMAWYEEECLKLANSGGGAITDFTGEFGASDPASSEEMRQARHGSGAGGGGCDTEGGSSPRIVDTTEMDECHLVT